jgi:flagellar FliL protein
MPAPRIVSIVLMLLLTLPLVAIAEDEGGASQPAYHELSPSLVANLPSGAKYIRCDVQLMTLDASQLPDIQLHAPAIRDRLLMLISEQDGAKLKTADGREQLRKDSLGATRELMRELTGKEMVDEIFFTAFFVQ